MLRRFQPLIATIARLRCTSSSSENRVYTAALLGFIVFYGLENLVAWSRERVEPDDRGRDWTNPVFLLHVGGFALYAWLVTYLMVRGISDTPLPIALYATAMGLHFIGIDHSLLREHGATYMRVGRFALAAAALAGWSVAMVTEIGAVAPDAVIVAEKVFSWCAGGSFR
jgi:hypothetical protein